MSGESIRQFKKQLPRNSVTALLSFFCYSLSAIWLTPYLVKHLGMAAYGLVPLAALFTQYVTIITTQVSSAVNRFLTLEIQKPGGNPNIVFNSAFLLYLLLVLVQLPLFGLGLLYADKLFSIPQGLRADALVLLGCSACSFLISLPGAVFGVSMYAKNRLDIRYVFQVVALISRLVLIATVFSVFSPRLRYLGMIDLGLGVLAVGFEFVVWKRITPELHFSFREINWRLFRPIFKMSAWTLVKQLGALLYLRTDIWIINRFISPVAAGKYASVLVLANFIKQIGGRVAGQAGPTIMAQYARGELDSLVSFMLRLIKYTTFLLALLAGILCGLSSPLMGVWLGSEFTELSPLVWVLVTPLFLNVGFCHLYPLHITYNKVKTPALVTISLGIVNVLGSYYLGVVCQYGTLGVAIMTSFVLCLNDSVFTPQYNARRVLGIPPYMLYRHVLPGIGLFLFSACLAGIFAMNMSVHAWGRLFLVSSVAGLLSLFPMFFLFSKSDRKQIGHYAMKLYARIGGPGKG